MTAIEIKIPILLDLMFVWSALLYRLARYGYPYRKIPLGDGRFTIVDPLIFYELNKYHWTFDGEGDCIYAVRHVLIDGRSKTLRMHRIILKDPPGLFVDHKNNNSLDNRLANLRPATRSQNACNRAKIKTKTSTPYIGACLRKKTGRYDSNIGVNGKKKFLGSYPTALEAARVYDAAARKYHGEFARLNFPNLTAENAETAEKNK